ncbi:MAG: hypothetical protein FJ405_01015, partial [Verrucomicrobia bacterium]|nr:hypothetical protein [Verrucomicrobiota bacterium]
HVKLLNSPAELRDIYLGADEDRVVQITLTVPQPISRAGLAAIFNLEVVQLVDAQIVGGVAYEVSVRGEDTDTDGDGIPDVSDPDDDNDGVPDGSDPNPLISDLPIPNIACATGLPYIFRAGLRDAAAFPTDPVFRGYCLSTAYPDAYWKEFDDIRSSAVFGMSFLGLPPGIAKGEFSFSARPLKSGSEENSIGMAIIPPCATPAFAWASLIGDLPEAGGDWSSNALTRFDLDLRALPPRPNFTSNLLAKLNADHALDLYVQRESLLDWMEMRLWTCPAAVFAHGLPHRAIGQAVLTNGPLGELFITQTTPGGGDGAYTHLGRAEGWSLETGMLDASTLPSGAYLQCMSAGSAGGDGNRLLGLARVEDVGTELGARFDFSVLQSPRYSLLVLSNEVVVAFLTNRIGLAATFPSPLSPTFRDTGGVAGADPASDGFRLSLHLGSLVTIQLPSTGTVTGNELVAWPEMGAERLVLDYRQGVFLTVNSVPSPAITAERAHSLGHEASALGQTTIHPSGAFLLLSNLGTNGTDGVRLHWEDALAGGGITFAELRDHPAQDRWVNTTGSWAQVRSIGELSPGAPQTLSQARITLVSTQSSLPYLVTADGSSMGAATGRISVWSNAVEVAAVTLGSASIEARTSAPWRELRRGASSERLTMEFTPGTLFQVGLQQVLGDALRVDWQGGSAPVAQREFELLSSGLLEMAVGAVCEKGSGGCAPMALEAGYNSDGDVVIHWGGCGYRLQAAESLESPVAWQNLSSSSPVVIPPTMSFRIFRLICE